MNRFLRAIQGDPSHEVRMRQLDAIGAKANAKINNLDREVALKIDHLAHSYKKAPQKMNGETRLINVRELIRDEWCQVLEISFAMMGFSPKHFHPHYCVVHVQKGEVIDIVRNKRFDAGEWYLVNPHEEHSAQSMSGSVITVFNTFHQKVAESILANKRYDPVNAGVDRVKFTME
jgi:quercetin dioxygenase-like cupin family protein